MQIIKTISNTINNTVSLMNKINNIIIKYNTTK